MLLINCYIDPFIWVDWTKSSVIFNTNIHQGLILSALYYSIYLSKLTMISPTISQGSGLLYSIITRSFHLNDRIKFNDQSHDFFLSFFFWQVTSGFELYAAFSPLVTKPDAINAINKLLRWIKVCVVFHFPDSLHRQCLTIVFLLPSIFSAKKTDYSF